MNTQAIVAITEESVRLALPVHYQSDVIVDTRWLSQLPDQQEFLWVLRENGTTIIWRNHRNADGTPAAQQMASAIVRNFGPCAMHFYHFSAARLQEIGLERFTDMARFWDQRMLVEAR